MVTRLLTDANVFLFIDANVYLDFYRLPSDDLLEVVKLQALVEQREVALYVTKHLEDEVWRNRERQLAVTLKTLKEQRPGGVFPQVIRNYAEFEDLRVARSNYEDMLVHLENQVRRDAKFADLPADSVLQNLFVSAGSSRVAPWTLDAAQRRSMLGNPPGKPGSVGDAIHWEVLLSKVPHGKDLHIITRDTDFSSPLDDRRLSRFLLEEWRERVGSRVHLHRTMNEFFGAASLDINLEFEEQRSSDVDDLVNAGSFKATHRAIEKLSAYDNLSTTEIADLVFALHTNPQIHAIRDDLDVKAFYSAIWQKYGDTIDLDTIASEARESMGDL